MTNFRPGGIQQLPTIVKNLLIINVLVFLVQQLFEARGISFGENILHTPITFDDVFALHYWGSPKFRWWQLFTHMFMHGSISHIFFNMFALWMFGRILENVWGPQRFLIFYFVCGIGAALCHLGVLTYEFQPFHHAFAQYQQNPNIGDFVRIANAYPVDYPNANLFLNQWQMQPGPLDSATSIEILKTHMNEATVGASGAIFGLLFAFGYLFPNTLLYLYFAIPVKAKYFVAGYAILELFSGIRNSAGDNIAHFAHLGGMLFAFILLRIWKDKNRNQFY
jgi:membrane associated rhomboid family serine protease